MEIDKDVVESLWGLYFGSLKDKHKAAVYRAYRDFNRTIDFPISTSKLPKEQKKDEENFRCNLKNKIVEITREEIAALHNKHVDNQEIFDSWHDSLCKKIMSVYHETGVEAFTYGQAQKWVNMTIKYLYLLQEDLFQQEFSFLHIPIDNYVLDIAEKKLHITRPKARWSMWGETQYKTYQNELRGQIEEDPLRWEFHNWLVAARSVNDGDLYD